MSEHALDLLDLLSQAIVSEVPDPIPVDAHASLSWDQYRDLERRFHSQDLDQACDQLARDHGLEALLEIAEFSALKLLLNLSSEADAAFASGSPLQIPASDWIGSWSDLRAARNRAYDSQLQAWARMLHAPQVAHSAPATAP